jgi:uncharacterized cofD-like protein
MKKILAIGGGSAMPSAVLEGLKKYPVEITAVSAMTDSGGSTGKLRKDYNVLPPGDIRRAFIALSLAPKNLKELFSYRFSSGSLSGHNLGNLLISGLEMELGDFEKVLEVIHDFLKISGKVLPVTKDKAHVVAVLENGRIVNGERNIDVPKHDGKLKIKKIFLKPKATAYKPVKEAIVRADAIIIGPGDLFSSLIPCLLPKGIKEALKKTKAKKIYICNILTKHGETKGFCVSDFVEEIKKYGFAPDFVIYNNKTPSQKEEKEYKRNRPFLLDCVKINERIKKDKIKMIGGDVLKKNGVLEHDSKKLAKIIIETIKGN